jgi:hypothetical protein
MNLKSNWLAFMAEDVEVFLNTQHIAVIESVGDKLSVIFTNGHKDEWLYVSGVHTQDRPKIDYPEMVGEHQ